MFVVDSKNLIAEVLVLNVFGDYLEEGVHILFFEELLFKSQQDISLTVRLNVFLWDVEVGPDLEFLTRHNLVFLQYDWLLSQFLKLLGRQLDRLTIRAGCW